MVDTETTVITGGTIVTGDGETVFESGAVVAAGERILRVTNDPSDLPNATVIDASGDVVMPGIINAHAHSLLNTPLAAGGGERPGDDLAAEHRDRHLRDGCTTVVNVDSFGLPSELQAARKDHPLKIELGCCPTPANIEAAKRIDGSGLGPEHEAATIPEAVAAGAVLFGEVGGPTLVGGVQRFQYVPEAVKNRTGKEISAFEANELIESVIGRYADPDAYDPAAAQEALKETGLAAELAPEDIRELVMEVTYPSVESAIEGFDEVASYSKRYGLPMLTHTAPPSKEVIGDLAERDVPLIAGHTNYPTFDVDEAVEFARRLRCAGATVEICGWDIFGETNGVGGDVEKMRKMFFTFVEEGLADYLATDYGDAAFESVLVAVEAAVEEGVASLPEAVALVTGNVGDELPAIGATRGTLESGKAADIVIVNCDAISEVKHVFVDGRWVVRDGERV